MQIRARQRDTDVFGVAIKRRQVRVPYWLPDDLCEECEDAMTTQRATGCYDVYGIPIHVGDLIRVKHYEHRRGGKQMWLYFRVAVLQNRFVVQNWNDLNADNHQCLLNDCGLHSAEVIADTPQVGSGEFITFNERKRRK